MIPAAVLARVPQVYEILIAIRSPLPDELWEPLQVRRAHGRHTQVLIPSVFEAAYVRQMLEAGLTVFEAQRQAEDLIFLDREQGYRLPDWEPVREPFAAACKLAWSRLGGYICLRDQVMELMGSNLMRVAERNQLRFNIGGVKERPQVGERVIILGFHPFLDASTPLLDAVAIWREEASG